MIKRIMAILLIITVVVGGITISQPCPVQAALPTDVLGNSYTPCTTSEVIGGVDGVDRDGYQSYFGPQADKHYIYSTVVPRLPSLTTTKTKDERTISIDGANYLCIGVLSHKSANDELHYTTLGIEFARKSNKANGQGQKPIHVKDDSSNTYYSGYMGKDSFVMYTYSGWKAIKSGETVDPAKVVYSVEFLKTIGNVTYVASYWLLSVDVFKDRVEEICNSAAGANSDWHDEIVNEESINPDGARAYYVKMNKVITVHTNSASLYSFTPPKYYSLWENGSVNASKGYAGYLNLDNVIYTKDNSGGSKSWYTSIPTGWPSTNANLKASVGLITVRNCGLDSNNHSDFEKLVNDVVNGGFSDFTINSINNSWHQDVCIALKTRSACIQYYIADGNEPPQKSQFVGSLVDVGTEGSNSTAKTQNGAYWAVEDSGNTATLRIKDKTFEITFGDGSKKSYSLDTEAKAIQYASVVTVKTEHKNTYSSANTTYAGYDNPIKKIAVDKEWAKPSGYGWKINADPSFSYGNSLYKYRFSDDDDIGIALKNPGAWPVIIFYIPVKEATNIHVAYVDVEDGKIFDSTNANQPPTDSRFEMKDNGKVVFTTKSDTLGSYDDFDYVYCTNEKEWGDYAPITVKNLKSDVAEFVSKLKTGGIDAGKTEKTYSYLSGGGTSSSDKKDMDKVSQLTSPTRMQYTSKEQAVANATVIVIPVRREKIVVKFVDVKTGKILKDTDTYGDPEAKGIFDYKKDKAQITYITKSYVYLLNGKTYLYCKASEEGEGPEWGKYEPIIVQNLKNDIAKKVIKDDYSGDYDSIANASKNGLGKEGVNPLTVTDLKQEIKKMQYESPEKAVSFVTVLVIPVKEQPFDNIYVRYLDVESGQVLKDAVEVFIPDVTEDDRFVYDKEKKQVTFTTEKDTLKVGNTTYDYCKTKEEWKNYTPITVAEIKTIPIADPKYEGTYNEIKSFGKKFTPLTVTELEDTHQMKYESEEKAVSLITVLLVPVKIADYKLYLHYVDVTTGELVGDYKDISRSYAPAKGKASHNEARPSILGGKLILDDGKEVLMTEPFTIDGAGDNLYTLALEEERWESYAPAFAYSLEDEILLAEYWDAVRKNEHIFVEPVIKWGTVLDAGTVYSVFSSEIYAVDEGLEGFVSLYVPVVPYNDYLLVQYVDDKGKTVAKVETKYNVDGSAVFICKETIEGKDGQYDVVEKNKALDSAQFFHGAKKSVVSKKYTTVKSKWKSTLTKATVEHDEDNKKWKFSCPAKTLSNYAVLFIPVKARPTVKIEYYVVEDMVLKEEPVRVKYETYSADKKYEHWEDTYQFGGVLIARIFTNDPSSTFTDEEWRTLTRLYDAEAICPAVKKITVDERWTAGFMSAGFSFRTDNLDGEDVTLKLYWAKKHTEPTDDPGESGEITKNRMGQGQNISGGTGSAVAAPDTRTYNYNLEFNIGEAIPTTEYITNGVEVDTWYGDITIEKEEVNPSARIRITGQCRYIAYELDYEEMVTYHQEQVDTKYLPEYEVYTWTDGAGEHSGQRPTGNYYEVPVYDWVPGTISVATSYHTRPVTEAQTLPDKSYDGHNDKYKYAFNYIKNITLWELTGIEVTNGAVDDTFRYDNPSYVPYLFIVDPVRNQLTGADEKDVGRKGNKASCNYETYEGDETVSHVGSKKKETHLVVESNDLKAANPMTYRQYFMGETHVDTPHWQDDYGNDDIDIPYVKEKYETLTDSRGRSFRVLAYEIDSAKKAKVKDTVKKTAKEAAEKCWTEDYVENENNRLRMHSDTVSVSGYTICQESSKEDDSGGLLYDGAFDIPDHGPGQFWKDYPDKVYSETRHQPAYVNTEEQTAQIPEKRYNGIYDTTIDTKYKRIAYGGGEVELSVSKDEAISLIPSHLDTKYVDNEPILVHSPVIAPISIENVDRDNVQVSNELSWLTQLHLDSSYTLNFDWEPLFLESDSYYRKGYHEDMNEGLTEYVRTKYIRFPFPVYTNAGKDTEDDTLTYYPLMATELNSNGGNIHSVSFTDWIELKKENWVNLQFYVPSWVTTGVYDESYDADVTRPDWVCAGIQVKVFANNSDATHKEEEATFNLFGHPLLSSPVDRKYVATFTYPVQVSGWAYDFELVATNDQTTYGDEENKDNVFNFVLNQHDMKVGTNNRLGTPYVRYTVGEDVTRTWDEDYTLPLTTGKAHYSAMGTMRQGTEFSYIFRTMLGGSITGSDDVKVEITPTFRYIDNEGKVYDDSMFTLYYDYVNENYIKYGSEKDTEAKSRLKCKLTDKWFEGVQRIDYQSKNYTYTDKQHLFEQYLNTWSLTATRLGITAAQLYQRTAEFGKLSKLTLTTTAMMFSGDEAQLAENVEKNGVVVKRKALKSTQDDILDYSPIGDEKEFRASMQTWYGMYRIPSYIYVLLKDKYDKIEDYFEENAYMYAEDEKEIFEQDGYLVLNFQIKVYRKYKGVWAEAYDYYANALDMWKRENGNLASYTAYNGAYKQGEFSISNEKIHSDHEVTIEAKSGDIAVIAVGKLLGQEGADEQAVGMLWINQ